ncbi:integrase core domain-containing protein [Aeromicrobium sp.]|uniref:integrase core domain-containing protein n=1 Tax=Aeromicrobium sp. TaxID=1871063 RepID=UPI00198B1DEB|nr:integrase core domain-containing protein [Aeromicrobium sp.]MBC7631302.1 transposase [Aeromicrobium sp.]
MLYTVWLAGGWGGCNAVANELRRLHITQKNGKPNHPTTQGKVDRFQQTFKKWLRAQPAQPSTIAALQNLLDTFVDEYNHHRSLPHRATPAALFKTMPKALPDNSRNADTHNRDRHNRIDKTGAVTLRVNGRLHHIGIGRTHVILLVHDLHVRVINAITGELLRELTIDPDKDYQPRTQETPEPASAGSKVSSVLRHHEVGLTGFEPATPWSDQGPCRRCVRFRKIKESLGPIWNRVACSSQVHRIG